MHRRSAPETVVIDAPVEGDVYLRLAAGRGWTIRYVADTHAHADPLSRARALAEAAGATLLLLAQDPVAFRFTPVEHGQAIEFGRSRITALSTPGHPMEIACYHVDGRALFTGDTLFISGVGRPGFQASSEKAWERGKTLYRPLRRLLELPADTLVFPGHVSEPRVFDRKPIVDRLDQISGRIAAGLRNEEDFLAEILDRIPPIPPNYLRIVALNEAGAPPEGDASELEAGANRCAVS